MDLSDLLDKVIDLRKNYVKYLKMAKNAFEFATEHI